MNISILVFAVFYIIYGIFGLFGLQNIPEKFKNHAWTRRYARICGVCDLLLGVPWAAAWLLRGTGLSALSVPRQIAVYLALALPSLALSLAASRQYRRRLQQEAAA